MANYPICPSYNSKDQSEEYGMVLSDPKAE
jgi:hypothetical protein